MRIGKLEILTGKELRRRLRLKEKNGFRSAMFEIAHAEKVLWGHDATLRDCTITGKVVLMGDEAMILHNTIMGADVGVKVM